MQQHTKATFRNGINKNNSQMAKKLSNEYIKD